MIPALLAILLSFLWLGIETKWLTVRLLIGETTDYGKLWIAEFPFLSVEYDLTERVFPHFVHKPEGYEIRHALKGSAKVNGKYEILLSPNCEPMCGGQWLIDHWNDLADYTPQVYMDFAGVRYNMTIRAPEIIPAIMKANKLSREERKEVKAAGIIFPKRVRTSGTVRTRRVKALVS